MSRYQLLQEAYSYSFFFLRVHVFFTITFLIACAEPKQSLQEPKKEIETIVPPKVTVLAELPDTLQPVVHLVEPTKPFTAIIPPPKIIYVDSITGLPKAASAQGKGNFTTYTTDEGLAHDGITCSLQDSKGHLWFGTSWGGLSRFDGVSFTNFSIQHGLPSNRILSILEDRSGNLLIGTMSGLSRYDGYTFKTFTKEDGLGDNDVRCMMQDRSGLVWIGTWGGGVSSFDGTKFQTYTTIHGLPSNIIRSILEDKSGKLWFGTWGGGVSCYDHKIFRNFSTADGLVNNDIWSIAEDRRGHLWFAAYEGGVSIFDGSSFETRTIHHGLPHNVIRTIKKDFSGNLWFCSWGGGVAVYNDTLFTKYTTKNGLANNTVSCFLQANDGVLWFGTSGGGISRYAGPSFINFTAEHGLANTAISSIHEGSTGQLWFGSWELGASLYDHSSFTTLTKKEGLVDDNIWSMIEDRAGHLWFGTDFGVSRYDGSSFISHSKLGNVEDAIVAIHEDRNGILWFGTSSKGLVRYDGLTFTNFTDTQGLSDNHVRSITEDRTGRLWLATILGLSCYKDSCFYNFTTDQGLTNNNVQCVEVDSSGNLWIGTESGLNFLSKTAGEKVFENVKIHQPVTAVMFETFSVSDGLPDNSIKQVLAAHDGSILIGTNEGIAVLNDGLESLHNGEVEIYNSATGYPIKNVRTGQRTLFKDSNGIIWVATGSDKTGLVRFDPKAMYKNFVSPSVFIQSVKINNEIISWNSLDQPIAKGTLDSIAAVTCTTEEAIAFGRELRHAERDSLIQRFNDITFDSIARWYPHPINLKLPYRHNHVTFDFHTNITARHHLVRYQYMLEGYEDTWSPVTEKSFATFGNIKEGKYTFKVKARNPEGIWSDPVTYNFSVMPPLRRTWYAYSLYGLLVLSFIYTGFKFQKRRIVLAENRKSDQKQAVLNERLRISRDLHDELGSTLSGIVMYSHLAKGQARERKAEAEHSINVVQQSASDMVTKLNDVVWLVNPINDNLEKLIKRLEEYAIQIASAKNINVVMQHEENLVNIILPVDTRRSIYMFCKEAINNAVKYSGGTTVHLNVHHESRSLEFRIKDNGTGFDPENIKPGNGLNNMQKRADEIGGKMVLESHPDQGTSVALLCRLEG